MLPDAFRWVQVLRRNSKLSNEEEQELTYLQSLVQTYFTEPHLLHEELTQYKADLTARFTNNEIKQKTREKLFVLIADLMQSDTHELSNIAHNEGYFGLHETTSIEQRRIELHEKSVMKDTTIDDD